MYFWPGLLILLGLNLLISKQNSPAHIRTENVRRNTSNQKEYNGFLNSVNEKVENTNFEQCSVNGVLASIDMDFSGVVFEKEQVTIEVNSVIASVSLKLPKGIRVEMTGSPVLGEVHDRSVKNITTNQSIRIHYTCILGSIEIYQ
jgi:predicted membrane protein